MSQDFELAGLFPEASVEEWQQLLAGVLTKQGRTVADGVAPESLLTLTSDEGIRVAPIYFRPEQSASTGLPGESPFVRGRSLLGSTQNGWDIRQLHAHPDVAITQHQIADDLQSGVTSLWLKVGDGFIAPCDVAQVLKGVYLDMAPVAISAGTSIAQVVDQLLIAARESGVEPGVLRGNLGIDPLGLAAQSHDRSTALEQLHEALSEAVRFRSLLPGMRPIVVDATIYADAGSGPVDQLAFSIATGVAYLRSLAALGGDLAQAAELLEFRYAIGTDQFTGIALLRAARQLWNRVLTASGQPGGCQVQHAVTSGSMLTVRDPWVNMLRVTVACFAAAAGGSDSITVAPFDHAIGFPNDFSRRIARNTQSILQSESHVGKVVDPVGGSWYVEDLTDQLARSTWQVFGAIDGSGGMAEAVRNGLIDERIAIARERTDDKVRHRTQPITGVSEFPLLAEEPVTRDPWPDSQPSKVQQTLISHEFDELRSESDRIFAETGQRPRVLLAVLGPVAEHTVRANFAMNLLASGGIESIHGTTDLRQLATEFAAAQTPAVCICSSNNQYAENLATTIAALRSAGAALVAVAGPPDPAVEQVDLWLHAKSDVISSIQEIYAVLEAQA